MLQNKTNTLQIYNLDNLISCKKYFSPNRNITPAWSVPMRLPCCKSTLKNSWWAMVKFPAVPKVKPIWAKWDRHDVNAMIQEYPLSFVSFGLLMNAITIRLVGTMSSNELSNFYLYYALLIIVSYFKETLLNIKTNKTEQLILIYRFTLTSQYTIHFKIFLVHLVTPALSCYTHSLTEFKWHKDIY